MAGHRRIDVRLRRRTIVLESDNNRNGRKRGGLITITVGDGRLHVKQTSRDIDLMVIGSGSVARQRIVDRRHLRDPQLAGRGIDLERKDLDDIVRIGRVDTEDHIALNQEGNVIAIECCEAAVDAVQRTSVDPRQLIADVARTIRTIGAGEQTRHGND